MRTQQSMEQMTNSALRPGETSSPVERVIYSLLRYFVAFQIITYGFAKLNGAQFTVLRSELDKPLGEVSGFWLTWYYFGYSRPYGDVIALVQIACGVMLMFRKTALLAACLLLPVVANIVLIDIFFRIDLGALLMALLLAACLFLIISFHRQELVDLFWTRQNSAFPERPRHARRALRLCARALVLVFPALFTYYVANYNNRAPTPIDGRWKVLDSPAPVSLGGEPLTYVYFERNRAYMCVFRFGAGVWQEHHFEADAQTGRLVVWEKWLVKGGQVFAGKFERSGDRLIIDGEFDHSNNETVINLERQD